MAVCEKGSRNEAIEDQTVKSQTVRLLDVFAIGPLMVWGGLQAAGRNPVLGNTLAVLGVLTVIYNGQNYLKVRDR